MALIIRMRQQGASSRQSFRVVLTNSRNPRDGKYLEKLGWYNPFGSDENNFFIDVPRIQHWLNLGAEISDSVKNLARRFAPEIVQQIKQKKVAKLAKRREKRAKK